MGGEILELIILPGLYVFGRLCFLTVKSPYPRNVLYLTALLIGLALGVRGMVTAYLPSIPLNYNAFFLTGWFLMSASFWLIVTYAGASMLLFFAREQVSTEEDSSGPET